MSPQVVDNPGRVSTAACPLAYGPNPDRLCEWDGRPLPATRIRWCSPDCEIAFEEAHVWPRARIAALGRAARRCAVCSTREDVEVHHDPPVDRDGEGYAPSCAHHAEHLRVLCTKHHAAAHKNLRAKPGKQLALPIAA